MSRFRLRRAMLALAGAVLLLAHTPPATAMDPVISRMAGFDPSFLISDAVMDDASTMTRDEVIAFVAARGAQCRPAADGTPCLKDAVVDTPARAATPYCAAMQGSTAEPAASYVWRVSQACGINPQVLLVLMQREQSIVSTVSPTQKMYTSTLGFACRDGIPCDPAYDGLVNQVYAAASRLNEYREPANRYRYQVGGTYAIPLYPGKPECGTWTVQMRSAATAALYNYTPFVPNPAALDNPYGAGDACSTYGNRNFYRIFKDWFGAPNSDGSAIGYTRFLDVSPQATQFVTEIQWLGTSTLANGWPDGTFRPLEPASRGAVAAFLYRLAGRPTFAPPARSPFRDVPTTHLFYKEITWLRAVGITTGWPDGTFRPESTLTRDAFAAFLYRFHGGTSSSLDTGFWDVPATNMYAREIAWMRDSGITTGHPDGSFRPLGALDREQIAAFVYRFDQRF